MTIDQHAIYKERKVYADAEVAKAIANWLQEFLVLGCIMGQKHLERCSEFFTYMDLVYSAYKFHGGVAWWKYDEEFRCRLCLQLDIGWDTKAPDEWLRLMMPQRPHPFPAVATNPATGQGSVAARHTRTFWLFNEGHCKFYGLCKFRHECSSCGGTHAVVQCLRLGKQGGKPPAVEGENAGEHGHDAHVARPVSQ